jgi:hypothetical protein
LVGLAQWQSVPVQIGKTIGSNPYLITASGLPGTSSLTY